MTSNAGDFWLKAAIQVGPFAGGAPSDQQVAELLAKQPWAGWIGNGEIPFQWETVDRPEPGSAAVAFLQPGRLPPPDGLRYLPASPAERVTVSAHTVTCPTSQQNPTQSQPVQLTLECHTIVHGHLPPTSRNSGLLPDSPELGLSRFRRRWHISHGAGHPNLWLFFWGQNFADAPPAPQGWEREPVRAYPLSKNAPTEPVWIFGSRTRAPGPAGQLPGSVPQSYPPHGLMAQNPFPSAALANSPYARVAPGPHQLTGPPPPTMHTAASYQQMQAHQQAMLQSQAQAQAKAAHAQLQAQQQQQQQQQQAQHLAQQQALQSRSRAAAATGPAPSDDPTHNNDILDVLTTRQVAIARFARNHDLLAGVLDPWTTTSVLAGHKRRKEEGGERGERRVFSRLANEAGPGRGKNDKLDLEERSKVLQRMLDETESEIGAMRERQKKSVEGLDGVVPGVRITLVGAGTT